jgi:hypothetical protein
VEVAGQDNRCVNPVGAVVLSGRRAAASVWSGEWPLVSHNCWFPWWLLRKR